MTNITRPHAIVNLSGKTYACPGWFEVPASTTLFDLRSMDFGVKIPVFAEPKISLKKEFEIPSTDGKKTYKVKFDGRNWLCNCVGYSFRRTCKHVEEAKKK